MYLLTGEIIRSLWLSFIGIMLFNKSYNIIISFTAGERLLGLGREVNFVFSFMFADLILLVLWYFLRFRDNVTKRKKHMWDIKDALLLGILICAFVSTIIASNRFDYPWYSLLIWLKFVFIYYFSKVLYSNHKDLIKPSLEIIIIFVVFNSIMVVLQKIHGAPLGLAVEDMYFTYGRYADEIPGLFRPGGISWNANLTSSIVAMIIPITFELSLILKNWKRKVLQLCLFLMLLAIVLMASRWVWMVMFFLVIYWWKIKRNNNINVSISKYWILFILAITPFIFLRMASLKNSLGFQYRLNHLNLSLDELIKNPFGLGMDMFKYRIVEDYSPDKYFWDSSPPHNLFLEMFTATGWIGGGLFLVFIILVLKDGFLNKSFLFWPILTYLLVNQMYSSLFSVTITELFWIFLGMFYAENN